MTLDELFNFRSWGVKGDKACEDSWSEPGTYNWIVPCALFTHINASVCPRGRGEKEQEIKSSSVGNSTPCTWAGGQLCPRPASEPLASYRRGIPGHEGGSVVRHLCVFHATWSTDIGQRSHLELYWKSSHLRDRRMSFQCGAFKGFSRITFSSQLHSNVALSRLSNLTPAYEPLPV